MRLSSIKLRVETERYSSNPIPREDRTCLVCNTTDIEDEYHFTLVCPAYSDFRETFIPRYYYIRPSVYKYISLLNSSSRRLLFALSKYIETSLAFRKELFDSELSTSSLLQN